MARLTNHHRLTKALVATLALTSAVAPLSAHASVVMTSLSSEATYTGTVASYNFAPAPPYVNDASVTRDASREHLPEPATWAMMILGFFGLSFAVRGRGSRKPRARVRYN